MSEVISCARCGGPILAATAAKTGGLCMPCKTGTREQIDEAVCRRAEKRDWERNDPFRRLWLNLVDRVHQSPAGFDGLSEAERTYWAVGVLQLEVYNGGFEQYFFNSSGSDYTQAIQGLHTVGAIRSAELLRQAKEILFAFAPVPIDTSLRRQVLRDLNEFGDQNSDQQRRLDELDKLYCADPDDLDVRIQAFARQQGLVS